MTKRASQAPPELEADEQAEWQRITELLERKGLLDNCDRAMLTAYCAAWARWWRCHRKVAETGGEVVKSPSGFPIQNPWLSSANQALRQLTQLSATFGLTPSSRRRARSGRNLDPTRATQGGEGGKILDDPAA